MSELVDIEVDNRLAFNGSAQVLPTVTENGPASDPLPAEMTPAAKCKACNLIVQPRHGRCPICGRFTSGNVAARKRSEAPVSIDAFTGLLAGLEAEHAQTSDLGARLLLANIRVAVEGLRGSTKAIDRARYMTAITANVEALGRRRAIAVSGGDVAFTLNLGGAANERITRIEHVIVGADGVERVLSEPAPAAPVVVEREPRPDLAELAAKGRPDEPAKPEGLTPEEHAVLLARQMRAIESFL